jgi:hypothetical protein
MFALLALVIVRFAERRLGEQHDRDAA